MKYTISGQCPNVDINITRQGQVDSFKILYPACTNITRSLNLELTNMNNIDSLIVLNGKQNIINIFFNTNLPLNGLNNIDSIKFLGISNPLEITGLKKLKYVGQFGLFDIKILDLSQLKSIDRIDFLNISASDIGENVVSDLIRLPNLNYVRLLVLNGNLLLDGIANIDTIEKIVIQSNKVLSKLSQLKTLKNIHFLTHLTLSGLNTNLNLEGLEDIHNLKELTLRNIKQISSLNPLRNIRKIEFLNFDGIKYFEPIDLSELTSIEEINNFFLIGNKGIQSLNGFPKSKILNKINLKNNINLNDITGLNNIKDVKYNDTLNFFKSLEISNNPSLDICNIKPICEMLKSFPSSTINISNNKSGCSSVENILSGCISNAHDKFSLSNEIEIFPNPTTGELNIGSIENIEKIKIYRMDGTLESYFENIKSRTININACSDGLKFVYIYNEGRSNPQIKKVIKIK